MKDVKTEVAREVPVHPTLAGVLAAWKLGGPERIHRDLAKLELRKRRLHDLRRIFIFLALGDGARKDILRWIMYGPSGDIMDAYTTHTWEVYCAEVVKLRIGLLEG